MSSRNVTMMGSDPRIAPERPFFYGSVLGRDVIHFHPNLDRGRNALCGVDHGYDRYPWANPALEFTVCAACLRKAGPVTHTTEVANGTASL